MKWLVLVSQRQILNLLTVPVFIFHIFLLRQEDFQSYFAFSQPHRRKTIWCAVEGEMMADRMFKAKLELRFFHVRLPLETE